MSEKSKTPFDVSSLKPDYTPGDIPALLHSLGIRPSKGLGQNFIIDEHALKKIVEAGEITPSDAVLEIGAGVGNLTRLLAESARQVVAVELDRKMLAILEKWVVSHPNVRLVAGDILKLDPAQLVTEPDYLVVANIPYYITSSVIRRLLESVNKPKRMVLTVQQEVARRICVAAGEMNLLALSVQVYGAPQIVARIPAGAFYPPPKVDSAVARIDLYPQPVFPQPQIDCFFKLAKAGFGQKRKTLRNALSSGLHLSPAETHQLLETSGISPLRRAETLSLEEWRKLVAVFCS
jgi:16S rRNA (adenine1518-N6/adenine1519-N6)-dimethyltransferase